jgi:hypothetical protein
MSDEPDREKYALKHFLDYQRASVRSIVEGMDEAAWHRSVVPSGWTPAGLVQHLGDAERHWFQQVMTGTEIDLPWDEGARPTTRTRRSSPTGRPRSRWIVLHMLEETASHSGHLDIVRELIDGQTDLGLR